MVLVNPLKKTCQQLYQCWKLVNSFISAVNYFDRHLPIRPTIAWTSSFGFLVPILDGVSGSYPLIVLVSDIVCWLLVLLHWSSALPYRSLLESYSLIKFMLTYTDALQISHSAKASRFYLSPPQTWILRWKQLKENWAMDLLIQNLHMMKS